MNVKNSRTSEWIYCFFVDITEHMLHDKRNHLRVIVDNSQVPNSRWYTGSGIYRDVMLYVGNTLHIKPRDSY